MKGVRTGHISAEDAELWRNVTRTLKPLRRAARHVAPQAAAARDDAPRARPKVTPSSVHAPMVPTPTPVKTSPRLQALEPNVRRKLARGTLRADAKLDLHGMRQHEAHGALIAFLHRARGHGARVVIVVTGKGRGSRDDDAHAHQGGVLQRMARLWLAAPELRDYVVGFEETDIAHGGSGALYVRLRRERAP